MRHVLQQDLAFDQSLAHQADVKVFEITQTTVKQFCRGRGRGLGQIIHFGQGNRQTTSRRIAGNAATVNAAADYKQVMRVLGRVGVCHF